MSNVIKAYTVRYDDVSKITIDTHFKIDKALEEKRSHIIPVDERPSGEFMEGLNAVVIDPLPSVEETSEKASVILEDAKNEAKAIIERAKKEAEQIKSEAFSAAQKKGYDEGILQTKREAQRLSAEYNEKEKGLQMEFEALAASLEPQMAQVIAELVEKMTGILVSDREDIILYLINKAMKNLDKSDSYNIKVSSEDYDYVNTNKELLQNLVNDRPLYITEDPSLIKNQCMIETDLRIIDCSLDHQLNNLITDLKLLGGI